MCELVWISLLPLSGYLMYLLLVYCLHYANIQQLYDTHKKYLRNFWQIAQLVVFPLPILSPPTFCGKLVENIAQMLWRDFTNIVATGDQMSRETTTFIATARTHFGAVTLMKCSMFTCINHLHACGHLQSTGVCKIVRQRKDKACHMNARQLFWTMMSTHLQLDRTHPPWSCWLYVLMCCRLFYIVTLLFKIVFTHKAHKHINGHCLWIISDLLSHLAQW